MARGPADSVLDSFKSLVFDPLVKVAIDKILLKVTFLAWGPLAFLFTKLVVWISDLLYAEFREVINIGTIRVMNAEHQMAYEKASIEEYMVSKDKGINSPEFRKARDENKKRLAKFVHYVVSNGLSASADHGAGNSGSSQS